MGIVNIKAISAQFTLITRRKVRKKIIPKVWKNSRHERLIMGISLVLGFYCFVLGKIIADCILPASYCRIGLYIV